jgi:hypothetical protein
VSGTKKRSRRSPLCIGRTKKSPDLLPARLFSQIKKGCVPNIIGVTQLKKAKSATLPNCTTSHLKSPAILGQSGVKGTAFPCGAWGSAPQNKQTNDIRFNA